MKKIVSFFVKPPFYFSLSIYLLFIVFSILSFVGLAYNLNSYIMNGFYAVLGITFFYGMYLFFSFDFKKLRSTYRNFLNKLSSKNKFLYYYINDLYFKTMFSSIFAFLMNLFFVVYNCLTAIFYHFLWNASISIYYFVLLFIRFYILSIEFKMHKKKWNDEQKAEKRIKIFKMEGFFLIVLDLAMVAPVTLIALLKKEVSYPMWIVILNAAFTFYKVIMCIKSFIKSRKSQNLTIRGLKNITLTEALVSILNLEYAMILTFSTQQDDLQQMHYLIMSTSFIVIVFDLIIAIITLYKSNKERKKLS